MSAASEQASVEASRTVLLGGGVRPEHVLKAGVQLASTQFLHLAPVESSMQSHMQWSLVQPVRDPKHAEQASLYPWSFSMHLAVHEAPPRHWHPHLFRSVEKAALPAPFQIFMSAASEQASVEASRTVLLGGGVRPEHVLKAGVQLASTQFLHLAPVESSMQSHMQWSLVQPVRDPKQAEQASLYPWSFSMHLAVHEAPPRHWRPHLFRSVE